METNETKTIEGVFDFGMKLYIQTIFNSEEEMKSYYLQMSKVIQNGYKNPTADSESDSLKKLCNKLKHYHSLLQKVGDHEWEKGVADIQKALGIYLMQNDIDSKLRKQTNNEIASQLQFIVYLSGNINIFKQLQGIFTHHISNITYLLKLCP